MSTKEDDEPVGRQDNKFFHQDSTKDAIVALAEVQTLIIYCGAGVTIDRTGLSWQGLVERLLRDELAEELAPPVMADDAQLAAAVSRRLSLLRDHYLPIELASILNQMRTHKAESRHTESSNLVSKLQTILYKDNGWQAGVLVHNIVRLAVANANRGRRVIIVTTNFDEYIERGFADYRASVRRSYRDTEEHPSSEVKVSVLSSSGNWVRVKGPRSACNLELVYLHGRVPRRGGPSGQLVLSESDYHSTHDAVVRRLTELFAIKQAGLLILGSAGTDPPLLAALAAQRRSDRRVALMPVQSTGMLRARNKRDFEALLDYVRLRGRHFGVTYLVPDFHYQIAQFCEEVLVAVGLPRPSTYKVTSENLRYGLRLVAWWGRWSRSTYGNDPVALHDELASKVELIRELLKSFRRPGRPSEDIEMIKVELWVRSTPKNLRILSLWGTSAGVLTDRQIIRHEELRVGSGNASIRAFVEGQPQLVSRDELVEELFKTTGSHVGPSRWKMFLSVPIRVAYSSESDPVGAPLGVLTLATMNSLGESDIPHNSSKNMESLVEMLRDIGRSLLKA